jgi:transketolase
MFIDKSEISRIVKYKSYLLNSLCCKINTLHMIQCAGSGHIGSSFSSMELFIFLLHNNKKFFSSKGHDAPGLYSSMIFYNKIDYIYLHKFRKIDGLPGHPDISVPNILTNTGSLGMGVAKAKGIIYSNRLKKIYEEIYVIFGDGELQEGSFWESLISVVNNKMKELTIIIDNNKFQSDTSVKKTSDLGDLKSKFESYGFIVYNINGHNFKDIEKSLLINSIKPKVIIGNTIKGNGVNFLEAKDKNLDNGLYRYHSGSLNSIEYKTALNELKTKINIELCKLGFNKIFLTDYKYNIISNNVGEQELYYEKNSLITHYSKELIRIAKNKSVVVLDCDLCKDTGTMLFKSKYPDRFFECGIAEMDAVSTAGTMALNGMIPIVHSFACFLTSRANEQIFNNSTELTKIIYMGFLAGLLPAGPGHSHQMVRDTSIMSSIHNIDCLEPYNQDDLSKILDFGLKSNKPLYIRIVSIPCNTVKYKIDLQLEYGKGIVLKEGADILIISSGPLMLGNAINACKFIDNISIKIINLPWLNTVDNKWLLEICKPFKKIMLIENHYIHGGQISFLIRKFNILGIKADIKFLAVREIVKCGGNQEVLKYHNLDSKSIAKHIKIFAKKENIVIVVQARFNSSRLNGKILKTIGYSKISFLKLQILRLQNIKTKTKLVIAIADNQESIPIIDLCKKLSVSYYLGSEKNVLQRTVNAANYMNADIVVRTVSDCPFIDIDCIDKVINKFKNEQCNYMSNLHPATWADGNDVEVMDIDTLIRCFKESKCDYQKEHVTPYIWDNPNIFNISNVENNEIFFDKFRFVLDYPEDYQFFDLLYKQIEKSDYDNILFSNKNLFKILKQNKDIYQINRKHQGYQWYLSYKKSLKTI